MKGGGCGDKRRSGTGFRVEKYPRRPPSATLRKPTAPPPQVSSHSPARTLSASITISPETTALVVAMA